MIRKISLVTVLFALATTSSAGPVEGQTRSSSAVVLYEAARFIPGDGRQPIANGAMLVENGTITKIGPKGDENLPRGAIRVDLGDKTVMPALINTHGHPGFQRGITYSADNFTRDTIMDTVWGYDYSGESNVLEVYVGYLRQKLEAGGEPRLLYTMRGSGYVLKSPTAEKVH